MNIWDLLSFIALLAAAVPPLYFAGHLRKSSPSYASLSFLLAASFLVHGTFHFLEAMEFRQDVVLATEAASAGLILVFGLAYWPVRRRRS